MDNSGGLMGNGQKLEVKTRQKDVFQTQQKEEIKEQSLTGAYDQLDAMFSGQLSVNKKAIPKDNIPDPKVDATELLQSRASLQEQPRELHVAYDGNIQVVEKEDGHYMTKLKRLLNGNSNIRSDAVTAIEYSKDREEYDEDDEVELTRMYYNNVEFTAEDIKGWRDSHNLQASLQSVISTMDEIISTCRKYRLTHLWPWTQRGKQRKADVIRVQKEAEKRRKAAYDRLNETKKKNSEQVLKVSPNTITERATTGYRRVLNYGKTFLWGMTVRNAINTAGMAIASPFWLIGSAAKSLKRYFVDGTESTKWKWYGAFSLPHPHLPAAWYSHYSTKSIESIEQSEKKRLEKERKKYPKGSKQYEELSLEINQLGHNVYLSKTARWHAFFSGSSLFDDFGYTRDISGLEVDYNGMQDI